MPFVQIILQYFCLLPCVIKIIPMTFTTVSATLGLTLCAREGLQQTEAGVQGRRRGGAHPRTAHVRPTHGPRGLGRSPSSNTSTPSLPRTWTASSLKGLLAFSFFTFFISLECLSPRYFSEKFFHTSWFDEKISNGYTLTGGLSSPAGRACLESTPLSSKRALSLERLAHRPSPELAAPTQVLSLCLPDTNGIRGNLLQTALLIHTKLNVTIIYFSYEQNLVSHHVTINTKGKCLSNCAIWNTIFRRC